MHSSFLFLYIIKFQYEHSFRLFIYRRNGITRIMDDQTLSLFECVMRQSRFMVSGKELLFLLIVVVAIRFRSASSIPLNRRYDYNQFDRNYIPPSSGCGQTYSIEWEWSMH